MSAVAPGAYGALVGRKDGVRAEHRVRLSQAWRCLRQQVSTRNPTSARVLAAVRMPGLHVPPACSSAAGKSLRDHLEHTGTHQLPLHTCRRYGDASRVRSPDGDPLQRRHCHPSSLDVLTRRVHEIAHGAIWATPSTSVSEQ